MERAAVMAVRLVALILAPCLMGCLLSPRCGPGFAGACNARWKLGESVKPPGVKARITQSGLDFLKGVGVDSLLSKLGEVHIPDFSGSSPVSYHVYDLRFTSADIPISKLTVDPDEEGLLFIVKEAHFSIHGKMEYSVVVTFHGTIDIFLEDISLNTRIRIGVDSTGRPTVSSYRSDCEFNVGSVTVDIEGGPASKYDQQVATMVRQTLNGQACEKIANYINVNLEQKMKELDVSLLYKGVVSIDLSLVKAPLFNVSIDTEHNGEVYPMGNKTECPLPIPAIPPDPDTSQMIFLWITEFLPNSGGYAMQEIGYLKLEINPDTVPAKFKHYLNTSNPMLLALLPQICKMYPNMAIQINVNSTKAPVVKITPSGIHAALVGEILSYAILPNKTLAYLFTLSATGDAEFSFSSKRNNITWTVSSIKVNVSLVHSAIGPINVPRLRSAINAGIQSYILPYLNKRGAIGHPLQDIYGFYFVNPVVSHHQGFLKIGANVTHTKHLMWKENVPFRFA